MPFDKTSRHTPETRAKISAKLMGRVFTPEWRAKIGASHTGLSPSPETRAKISVALKGRPKSPDTIALLRAAHGPRKQPATRSSPLKGRVSPLKGRASPLRGRALSPDHRAKIVAALTGRTVSPETREKIAAAQRGKVISPEARARTSAGLKGRTRGPRSAEDRAKISAGVHNAPVLGECVYCFGPAQSHDHVIPRGRPSWDDPNNVVLACYSCNSAKRQRTPEEWFGL